MVAKLDIARVLCGLILACSITVKADNGTASQFFYESQLLEKMVRMEIKMEQMEGRINQSQEAVYKAIKKLDLTLDNKTAELKELENRVDTPLVAFFATRPQDQSLDTSQKLILQTVALNLGEGYDRHMGIFTAPTAGLYQFTAHMCNVGGNVFYYYIMLEGSIITETTKFNAAQSDCASSSVITQVEKGQRVWIQSASGSASTQQLYDSSYSRLSFSGVLLHK